VQLLERILDDIFANLTSKIQISFSLHETFEIADSLLQLYDLFFGSGRIFPIEKAIRDFIRLV
jgi:hypothetical protein